MFKKLGYTTTNEIINCVVNMRPGYIGKRSSDHRFGAACLLRFDIGETNEAEYLLWDLREKVRRRCLIVDTGISRQTGSRSTVSLGACPVCRGSSSSRKGICGSHHEHDLGH